MARATWPDQHSSQPTADSAQLEMTLFKLQKPLASFMPPAVAQELGHARQQALREMESAGNVPAMLQRPRASESTQPKIIQLIFLPSDDLLRVWGAKRPTALVMTTSCLRCQLRRSSASKLAHALQKQQQFMQISVKV